MRLFAWLLLAPLAAPLYAQAADGSPSRGWGESDLRLEYLWPSHPADRAITTVTIDAGLRRVLSAPLGARIGVGITASYAWGHIVQLDSSLDAVRLDNASVGLGPSVHASIEPLRAGRLSLGADLSGGLLYYASAFPAGGKRYNGMLRVGPMASWRFGDGTRMLVSGRWMHVSNGQGVVPHNPSYEAWAVNVGVSRALATSSPFRRVSRRGAAVGAIVGGAIGLATGMGLSRHCDADGCAVGASIALVGGLTGAASGVTLGSLLAR